MHRRSLQRGRVVASPFGRYGARRASFPDDAGIVRDFVTCLLCERLGFMPRWIAANHIACDYHWRELPLSMRAEVRWFRPDARPFVTRDWTDRATRVLLDARSA